MANEPFDFGALLGENNRRSDYRPLTLIAHKGNK